MSKFIECVYNTVFRIIILIIEGLKGQTSTNKYCSTTTDSLKAYTEYPGNSFQ